MNPFKALYCNQYYELEPKGKGNTAKKMGTILSTIALVLFLFSLFFLLITFFPDIEKDMDKFFRNAFGRRTGRAIGKFIALALFVIAYPLIRVTLGTEKSYQKTITRFNSKTQLEKEQISKKGLVFFVSSIITVVITIIVVMVFN